MTNRYKGRSLADKQQAKKDRLLCPVPVSAILRLKVRVVAKAMRKAGMDTPLTKEEAREFSANPSSAPNWLARLLQERDEKIKHQERALEELHAAEMYEIEEAFFSHTPPPTTGAPLSPDAIEFLDALLSPIEHTSKRHLITFLSFEGMVQTSTAVDKIGEEYEVEIPQVIEMFVSGLSNGNSML